MNVSTTDPAVARALRLKLWSERPACPEGDLRGADPTALLRERWHRCSDEQQRIVKHRSGLLAAALYPHMLGHVTADFGPRDRIGTAGPISNPARKRDSGLQPRTRPR